MPYVNESSIDPDASFDVSRYSTTKSITLPNGMVRSQYGYRSRGVQSPEVLRAIATPSNWANTTSLIRAFEEFDGQSFGTANRQSRMFLVNDRDYSEIVARPSGTIPWSASFELWSNYWDPAYGVGAYGITAADPGFPAALSPTTAQNTAAKMMRRTAPAQSEIDLTRNLGELKDFPRMLRASNWTPSLNPRKWGESYLNMVFGVKPTISDLQSTCETILASHDILGNYVQNEKIRMRRGASETLWSDSGSGSIFTNAAEWTSYNGGITSFGPMTVRGYSLLPAIDSSYRNDVIALKGTWSWFAHRTLRSFSTYEYFIPRPSGFGERQRRYYQMASRVLGGGLTPSTAYDLTPWTWLIDWFVDVGGLIRYQQTVADNQMIATNQGWTSEDVFTGVVALDGAVENVPPALANPMSVKDIDWGSATASFRYRKSERRPGSPYSVGPNWDMSPQQWAIAGAMGLTHSTGVKR